MNPKDMERFGYKRLDIVDLVSNYDSVERRAKKFLVVPYNIPQGNLGAYFPEANMVVPHNHYADKSNTPISKSIIVHLERSK
jgi:anaerobic selenocysteine-containing dehydrogenase